MRQLIEDLISAMEYHVEQTRPIHSTIVALQSAREALKAMPTPLTCDCNQGQVCHICDPIIPPQRTWVGLTEGDMLDALTLAEKATVMRPLMLGIFARAIEARLKELNT